MVIIGVSVDGLGGSEMDIRIREGRRKDRARIWKATMETVWNDLPPDERERLDRGAFEAHFRPHAERMITSQENSVFVAEGPAHAFVGYAILGPFSSLLSPRPYGFVYDLWVAPEARRRGVARRLLAHAEGWCRARGYAKLRLEVSARNAAARSLYASAGFAEERLSLGRPLPASSGRETHEGNL